MTAKTEKRAQFTPGPWIAVTENDGEGPFEVRAPPYIVARCFGDPGHYTPANQRLITQAPAMYEALRTLLERFGEADPLCDCDEAKAARAILAAIDGGES